MLTYLCTQTPCSFFYHHSYPWGSQINGKNYLCEHEHEQTVSSISTFTLRCTREEHVSYFYDSPKTQSSMNIPLSIHRYSELSCLHFTWVPHLYTVHLPRANNNKSPQIKSKLYTIQSIRHKVLNYYYFNANLIYEQEHNNSILNIFQTYFSRFWILMHFIIRGIFIFEVFISFFLSILRFTLFPAFWVLCKKKRNSIWFRT